MSECKAASEEAERLVDEVARSGAKRLSLARLRISRLPNSLRSLGHQLVELDLTGCRELADLGVLASLSKRTSLRSRVRSRTGPLTAWTIRGPLTYVLRTRLM